MQEQVGTLVGGGEIVDSTKKDASQGSSNLKASVFNATKDFASMRAALKTITWQFANRFTDAYLDTLTDNDMLFALNTYAKMIDAASTTSAWAGTTAYVVGNNVTTSGKTLQAIKAGTSASTAPTAPGAIGVTVTDGTVTWIRIA